MEFFSLMALVGDLIESMMKDAKIKDSELSPGHGSILDRIDSYIFTPSLFVLHFYNSQVSKLIRKLFSKIILNNFTR